MKATTNNKNGPGPGMLKVLLYDLGSQREELNEPIGLGCLKSYLEEVHPGAARTAIKLYPVHAMPEGRELAAVDIVGLSTRLRSLSRLTRIVESIRQLPPGQRPLLVLGDLLATFATAEVLRQVPEAICVMGEGEEPFAAIVTGWARACSNGSRLRERLLQNQVPNLALMHQGQLRMTPKKLVALESMPQPSRILTDGIVQKGGIIRVEQSRGCDWDRCSFCAIKAKYGGIGGRRRVLVSRAVSELEELSRLGVTSPYYTDEDFVGDDRQAGVDLAEAIAEARREGSIAPDMGLYINLRVANIIAREGRHGPAGIDLLKALKGAGLREVFLGVESGTSGQVKRYAKPATARTNLKALEIVRHLGLELDVGFIMFDPEMTLDELRENLRFIADADLWQHDSRLTGALRVQAGTSLADEYRNKELLTGPMDVNDLTFPYRYRDPRVEAVQAAFSAWEFKREDAVYSLQAATRGEMESESLRHDLKATLGQVRSAELSALAGLTTAVSEGLAPERVCLGDHDRCRDLALELASRALDRR